MSAELGRSHDIDACDDDDCPIARWNYRVVERSYDIGVPGSELIGEWALIECYYDANGRIVAWCEAPPMVTDVSLADLLGESKMRTQAIEKAADGSIEGRTVLYEEQLPRTLTPEQHTSSCGQGPGHEGSCRP